MTELCQNRYNRNLAGFCDLYHIEKRYSGWIVTKLFQFGNRQVTGRKL